MSTVIAQTGASWREMPCASDNGPAPLAAIGLIVLATDMASEPEMRAFLPQDTAVGLYVTRIPMLPVVTPESLAGLEQGLTGATELLLPGTPLDAVAFSCTSGSIAVSAERVTELVQAVKPQAAVTMPTTASTKALRRIGARRLAVLTPYVESVNLMIEGWLRADGFEIVVAGSFMRPGDAEINRVSPSSIHEAGVELARSAGVDALFVSCTGLRVSPVLESLEKAAGVPVVASNQAQAWDCLRLSGYDAPLAGRGRLFQLAERAVPA